MHNFKVSLSLRNYLTKEEARADYPSKDNIAARKAQGDHRCFMTFRDVEDMTSSELFGMLLNGYAVAHVFRHENICLGMKEKTEENFLEANCLFLDFDGAPMPMDEMAQAVPLKPTFAYYTYSNGEKGLVKFRFIYVLTKPITGKDDYSATYWGMKDMVECAIDRDANLDDSLASPAQYINGTRPDSYTADTALYFGCEYDPEVLPKGLPRKTKKDSRKSSGAVTGRQGSLKRVLITPNLVKDFKDMCLTSFLAKYEDSYKHDKFMADSVEYDEECHAYIVKSDKKHPFARLRFKFDPEGNRISWVHGDHRKYRVYEAATTFHTIYGKHLSGDHLLFLLAWYVNHGVHTADWHEDWKDYVVAVASRVISKCIYKFDTTKFVVDKSWCLLHGVKPKAQAMTVRMMLNVREVMSAWDCSCGMKKNVRQLNEMGIEISLDTVKRWKRKGIIQIN